MFFNRLIRLGYYAKSKNIKKLESMCVKLLRVIYSFQFRFNEFYGSDVLFCYNGLGIVIHEKVKIGNNVIISQHVTIGGRSKKEKLPNIKDNVYVGAGAIILGDVSIGPNALIGAGSIVLSDVPENSIVAGNPARIIKLNIENIRDYF